MRYRTCGVDPGASVDMAWQRKGTLRPLKEAVVAVGGKGRESKGIPASGVGQQWRCGNGGREWRRRRWRGWGLTAFGLDGGGRSGNCREFIGAQLSLFLGQWRRRRADMNRPLLHSPKDLLHFFPLSSDLGTICSFFPSYTYPMFIFKTSSLQLLIPILTWSLFFLLFYT